MVGKLQEEFFTLYDCPELQQYQVCHIHAGSSLLLSSRRLVWSSCSPSAHRLSRKKADIFICPGYWRCLVEDRWPRGNGGECLSYSLDWKFKKMFFRYLKKRFWLTQRVFILDPVPTWYSTVATLQMNNSMNRLFGQVYSQWIYFPIISCPLFFFKKKTDLTFV